MSAGLVIAIVVGALLALALILVSVLGFVRRRARRLDQRVTQDLGEGEPIRGPERRALYMGGTGPYPRISSNGKLTLTETHVTFRSVIGPDVVVPLREIVAVDQTPAAGSITRPVPRRNHLALTTHAGKIVIDVQDSAAWVDAVRAQIPR